MVNGGKRLLAVYLNLQSQRVRPGVWEWEVCCDGVRKQWGLWLRRGDAGCVCGGLQRAKASAQGKSWGS
jgi:hypothetical protein